MVDRMNLNALATQLAEWWIATGPATGRRPVLSARENLRSLSRTRCVRPARGSLKTTLWRRATRCAASHRMEISL